MSGDKLIVLPASTRTGVLGIRSPEDSPEKAPARTTKRVTFDLELQVHTIPHRIPIYERKPATSTVTLTKSHPLTFVPRPLDLRGRDRYTFGNGASGKIIDLFSPSNGFPAYTVPGSYKGVQKHWQPKKALELPTFTAPMTREPYSFSTARNQVKLSKAAENLRDITAELRDQFEQSYQPFLVRDNVKSPSRVTSASNTQSTGSVTHGANKQQPVFNTTRTRANSSQGARKTEEQTNKTVQSSHRQRSAGTSGGMTTAGHALRRIPCSVANENRNGGKRRQKLPHSVNRKNHKHRISIDMKTGMGHISIDMPTHKTDNGNQQGKMENSSPVKPEVERSLSRCSTIDTYVISDVDYPSRPITENMSCFPSRQGDSSTRTIRKRVSESQNRRSIAWGLDSDQAEDAIVDINNANNLSSYQTKEVPYRLAQWQVLPRAAKLST